MVSAGACVINQQWFFKDYRKYGSFLFKFQSFFIKCPPEIRLSQQELHRFILFFIINAVPFLPGANGLVVFLAESNHPISLQALLFFLYQMD
jgi:hypothetical protein